MAATKLVIFDCDGVLINTEHITIPIDVDVYRALGMADVTREWVIERCLGRSHAMIVAEVEQALGRTLEPDWEDAFQHLYEDAFERELRAIDGVAELLRVLHVPYCVASSSGHAHLQKRLGQTGLLPHFEGRIFSAHDVGRGKPFPDLFLHAAERMGARPSECLVIEDSPAGVEAAQAAGMPVLAFAESIVPRDRFPADVPWLEHMRDFPALVGGATG